MPFHLLLAHRTDPVQVGNGLYGNSCCSLLSSFRMLSKTKSKTRARCRGQSEKCSQVIGIKRVVCNGSWRLSCDARRELKLLRNDLRIGVVRCTSFAFTGEEMGRPGAGLQPAFARESRQVAILPHLHLPIFPAPCGRGRANAGRGFPRFRVVRTDPVRRCEAVFSRRACVPRRAYGPGRYREPRERSPSMVR